MKKHMDKMIGIIITVVLCFYAMSICGYATDLDLTNKVVGKRDFIWPVPENYNILSCYLDPDAVSVTHERKSEHYALDISAATYTNVVAAYGGEVVKAVDGGPGYNGDGFGNYIVIKHEGYLLNSGEQCTLYSRYSHLNSVAVKEHTTVSAGTVIGQVGQSGFAYGPHLDFQILQNDWSDRALNGLDPYANDLLELPSNLIKSATTDCCQSYIDAVKEKYSKPLLPNGVLPTSLELQIAPTIGDVAVSIPFLGSRTTKTSNKNFVWTRSGPGKRYSMVSKYSTGDTLKAIGYCRNEYGNMWYYLEDETYVYSANVTIQAHLSTASISGGSAPSGELCCGSFYILEGKITSNGNQLTKVTATIRDSAGKIVLQETDCVNGSYSIKNSKLDKAMTFNTLERGSYTYEISVEESVDTGTMCVPLHTVLYSSNFNIS